MGPMEVARGFVSVKGIALMAAAENYAYFLAKGEAAPGMARAGSEEDVLTLTEDFLSELEKWRGALGEHERREFLVRAREVVAGSDTAVVRIDGALGR
jgi:hypothetical protein